jgi:hypothetical protein
MVIFAQLVKNLSTSEGSFSCVPELPLDLVLSQSISAHILVFYHFEINYKMFLSSELGSTKSSLPFRITAKISGGFLVTFVRLIYPSILSCLI